MEAHIDDLISAHSSYTSKVDEIEVTIGNLVDLVSDLMKKRCFCRLEEEQYSSIAVKSEVNRKKMLICSIYYDSMIDNILSINN